MEASARCRRLSMDSPFASGLVRKKASKKADELGVSALAVEQPFIHVCDVELIPPFRSSLCTSLGDRKSEGRLSLLRLQAIRWTCFDGRDELLRVAAIGSASVAVHCTRLPGRLCNQLVRAAAAVFGRG